MKDPNERVERRMILENQVAIMTALIALAGYNTRITSDLYYHAAKTTAYIGPPQ